MRRHERWIAVLFVLQTLMFFVLYRVQASRQTVVSSAQPHRVSIAAGLLIGDKKQRFGNPSAPYTLVEFGDYQCPACAYRAADVEKLLAMYPDRLSFCFHHFPLKFHPYAMQCAMVSEMARELGQFWRVYEGLYALKTKVSPQQVRHMLDQLHINISHLSQAQVEAAKQRVRADMKLGQQCGVNATPTFFLCCPDGRVYQLYEPMQAIWFMHKPVTY
ncbi:MAG TPA: DsbA family protein [Chthonomonas sp.]|uniref:DsbA family protein n=1 Tax=Chthonomonas sp. TaxID=2282153 RepID=UPI002B4B6854|nr:DsbA family protein [Chthonomonas sp.]HLI49695.1 DsbA family protein [Chthonomonas sp.]